MKKIICYCSGGLGNRLKPMASCYVLSLLTNRQLVIVWEPTLRCMAPFNSLFSNAMPHIEEKSLNTLYNVKIFCPDGAADYESNLNNVYGLRDLARRVGTSLLDTKAIINEHSENIIVFSNTFLPDISIASHKSFFMYFLKINRDIVDKVDAFWKESGLTKDFTGVHARGTDFEDSGINADYYLNTMSCLSSVDFFVCSDSKEYEQYIKEKDGRNVVIRSDKKYVSKSKNGIWSNNVYTPTDSVQDSLIDLLLLARTNFQIYHPNSSFAHLVEYFKDYYVEPYKVS